MVNPFRDAIEPGPQSAFDTGHPVALALVEEELAPGTVPLHERLFVRLRAVGIDRVR